jgi:Rrf2 family iron-sulfur cluster assembly transcriptional regulator
LRITQEADYAFRIIRTLGCCEAEKMGSSFISEDAGIPHRFTFKILRKLTHAGITKSIRGKGGGYKLGKELSEITLLDIVEIIDGPVRINKCLEPDYDCTMHSKGDCSLHFKIAEISEKIRSELAAVDFTQFK